MRIKSSMFAGALIVAATVVGTDMPAAAEGSIYMPLFTYRTGPFSGSGIFIAEGMHDYLEMLNQRDGGIGGVKIALDECMTTDCMEFHGRPVMTHQEKLKKDHDKKIAEEKILASEYKKLRADRKPEPKTKVPVLPKKP